jgi:hypothetical protein
MHVHDIDAFLERRLLVNYRVDPEVVSGLLPRPFAPRLVNGYAIAGVCLIHMSEVRPKNLPAALGVDIQGSAHRVAVTWTDRDGVEHPGVYILRRDSGSRIVGLIGRRALAEHPARFLTSETENAIDIDVRSRDGRGSVCVRSRLSNELKSSVLGTLPDARAFFEHGGPGYTLVRPGRFTGVALTAASWDMAPVEMSEVQSAWLGNPDLFPAGTAAPDSALVMRRTDSSWRSVPMLFA